TAHDLMVHAHDGAAVAEVAIAPWWRRRLAYAFRFPGVIDVPNVWPGRALQDGVPKPTDVRAASMYQASEVERFAPGHHGYPRASEAD
ncbi:MAG: hypothetical protein WAU53_19910, partial [Rhodoplanes sp.]